ncbi:hypothetical protein AB1Y20_015502 [Prymnesium parvum]|uniref:Methyltransferase FkbM domain-containing protein n=1 Tax=Prymnesium parvum TaxID=97485 RepID=A0AB34K373_PRYPA
MPLAALTLLALCCNASDTRRLFRKRVASDAVPERAAPLDAEREWKVWNSTAPAVIPHPAASTRCRWTTLTPPPTPTLPPPTNGSICLRATDDLLCDAILRDHYWSECADLPALYALSASGAASGGLFLDVGANIGACSMHMLLSSEAPVVAFEPGANNLFYATSSFLRLGESLPEALGRLTLYPLAVGSSNSSSSLFSAIGNAGHSVIGQQPTLYAPRGHEKAQPIIVRTLDDVLWPRSERARPPQPIALMKLDVEGYECHALRGMKEILQKGVIHLIKIEVFDYGLRAQGCSGIELQQTLTAHGFTLVLAPADGNAPSPDALSRHAQHPPTVLHSAAPYNLYCFRSSASNQHQTDRWWANRDRPAGVRQWAMRDRRRRLSGVNGI